MCLESSREDTHATTIPLLGSPNLHAPIHTSELVGAWPCHLVQFSWRAHCILDMVPDTWLRMVPKVVPIPDRSRKVVSSVSVGVEYKQRLESLAYAPDFGLHQHLLQVGLLEMVCSPCRIVSSVLGQLDMVLG